MKRSINIVLMLLNVVGIFFYLKSASLSWAIPEEVEAGIVPAKAGVAMVWGLSAVPILLFFFFIDSIWLYASVDRKKLPPAYGLLMAATWPAAVVYDFVHH